MEPFEIHAGVAAPLRASNVDTDQIIPAEFLKRITRTGFEDALFFAWRQDPDFVLNEPAYASATVLVAGPDFGTGSSREHAVWALQSYGFRAVLSSRFADIFRGNCGKAGVVAAVLDQADIERIWDYLDSDPGAEVTVDLVDREVRVGGMELPFDIDDHTRERLLNGHDDISLTLAHAEAIGEFELRRPMWSPTTV
ncbi:MAG: 3-isopropylmalate dehydratase small subunit [Actinobacteria bacterium]|nr:MAG: 3-isopropylmalate dehydratase small subunit [Actinomycetota bacterium]